MATTGYNDPNSTILDKLSQTQPGLGLARIGNYLFGTGTLQSSGEQQLTQTPQSDRVVLSPQNQPGIVNGNLPSNLNIANPSFATVGGAPIVGNNINYTNKVAQSPQQIAQNLAQNPVTPNLGNINSPVSGYTQSQQQVAPAFNPLVNFTNTKGAQGLGTLINTNFQPVQQQQTQNTTSQAPNPFTNGVFGTSSNNNPFTNGIFGTGGNNSSTNTQTTQNGQVANVNPSTLGLTYNPIVNNSIINQRDLRLNQLQNLQDQYNAIPFDPHQDLGTFLMNRAQRQTIANQMTQIAGLLNNANTLSQESINNLNNNNLSDIRDQRGNLLTGQRQDTERTNILNEIQNRNAQTNLEGQRLNLSAQQLAQDRAMKNNTLNLDIAKFMQGQTTTNLENQIKANQLTDAQQKTSVQSQIANYLSPNFNPVSALSQDQLNNFLKSPEYSIAFQNNINSGLSRDDAIGKAIKDYASIQAEQQLNNLTVGLGQLMGNQKTQLNHMNNAPEIEIKNDTANSTVKGRDIAKVLAANSQITNAFSATQPNSGSKPVVIDKNGNVIKQ